MSAEALDRLLRPRRVAVIGASERQRSVGGSGTRDIRVNLRVIAASNRDLDREVREGRFREDLYFRLKVIPLELPPLRERRDDIPLLVEHFMQQFRKELGGEPTAVTPAATAILQAYAWPMGLALAGVAGMGTGGCQGADVPSPSGREMYVRYCASCHGVDGKGNGPVASSLHQPPPDLTRLAQLGRLDERYLMTVIDGRRVVRAHGPREMPVWGAVFQEELKDRPYAGYTGFLRAQTLADYLRSIQEE